MSQSLVDSGALKLAIDVLKRNAERHGQPSMLEVAQELEKTAVVMSSRTCENCTHRQTTGINPKGYSWCSGIATDFSNEALDKRLPYLNDNGIMMVPDDFYCKLWELKDDAKV